MTPTLLLLAGPNGSGKSTFASTRQFREMLARLEAAWLNPDELARSAPAGSNPLIWAGREMHRQTAALISQRKSLAIETTLSGNNHLAIIRNCRQAGYGLALHFIFVSSVELAIARVRLRVVLGGHDVPLQDQARRYERSLHNAARLIPSIDEAYIYNNDLIDPLVLLAEYRKGERVFLDREATVLRLGTVPAWFPA